MSMRKATCAALTVAVLAHLVGCSSSPSGANAGDAGEDAGDGGPPSATGLDGTWDIVFTGSTAYTRGTLYINPMSAQAKFSLTEESTAQGQDCTYVLSEDEIDLTLTSASVTGANAHLQQIEGLGCPLNQQPGTSIVRHDLPGQDMATRTSTLPSAFGKLGGAWTVMTPKGSCQVTFQDTTLSGTCESTTFTATLNGRTLSGRAPEAGFEFAAHLH
jgi:hypothetical protein